MSPLRDDPFRVDQGLATLGAELVEMRGLLDALFVRWAAEVGAEPMLFPPLLRVADLERLDYFRNFPHLATLATRIRREHLADCAAAAALSAIPGPRLADAQYVLPSAACYGVYAHLGDTVLAGPRTITTIAQCFRLEDEYVGLSRLWGFSMREIVCVGGREAVQDHLAAFKGRIAALLTRLGLPFAVQAAQDPFFAPAAPAGGAALMQQLFPSKEELVAGGVAVASLNFHRTFFGERCRIATADRQPAFSGCVAFGLERWLHALLQGFQGDLPAAARALRAEA